VASTSDGAEKVATRLHAEQAIGVADLAHRHGAQHLDLPCRAFVEQQGHDLPRRTIAEQLPQRLSCQAMP
jgi:hypothetical protein